LPSDLNSQFLVQIISTDDIIRSKNLEPELTKLGLKFQISPGVVPNEVDFQTGSLHSAVIFKLLNQRVASIGEVGCALAHRAAMHAFLNSNHKFGIIFEDDAEVISEFDFDILSELLDSDRPIIVVLGWIPGMAVSRNPRTIVNEELVELITPPTCTFAYAINRSAAKSIIGGNERIIDVADWPIYMFNKVHFYAPRWPWVTANHNPEFSTIGVRSSPISTSTIGVLKSRIRLSTYFAALILLSVTNKLGASPKQIVHQLFIRGALHRYGVSQVAKNSTTNEVVPLPLKFRRILGLLKLD
jgi:GR25 family glycosyltransferase involved in LPS biosynthesis